MKERDPTNQLLEIQKKLDSTIRYLQKHNYSPLPILASELVSYFEGDAPSGDTITLAMVLDSKWLLLHEVIEISELKKKGFLISSQLLVEHSTEVFNAHLTATSCELSLASLEGDFTWIRQRLVDIKNWLSDPSLSHKQVNICKELLANFNPKI